LVAQRNNIEENTVYMARCKTLLDKRKKGREKRKQSFTPSIDKGACFMKGVNCIHYRVSLKITGDVHLHDKMRRMLI